MEDWKNDRSEAEMKLAGEKMMKQAAEAKSKKEDEKWDKIKESLHAVSKETAQSDIDFVEIDIYTIDWVIDNLRKKYELPNEIRK